MEQITNICVLKISFFPMGNQASNEQDSKGGIVGTERELLEEEFKNLPDLDDLDSKEQFLGWWSDTGKPEPKKSKEEGYYSALAINIQPNGRYFFRDHEFSVRGTYYGGKWVPIKSSDNEILLFNNYKDNMKSRNGCYYMKGKAKILSNGKIKITILDKTYKISKVKV